jgi:hypothetical protein
MLCCERKHKENGEVNASAVNPMASINYVENETFGGFATEIAQKN